MAKDLFLFPARNSKTITFFNVLKEDVLPWLASILLICMLNFAMVALVKSSATNNVDFVTASAYLYQQAFPLYALAIAGCLLSRRKKDKWTWILAATVILFFFGKNNMTVAVYIFPNSVLSMMIAMLGLLALGRVIEYIRMRYITKLDEPIMSKGAWLTYLSLMAFSALTNSTLLSPLLS